MLHMSADDIADFVRSHVRTFEGVEVLPTGTAFHYTHHGDAIQALGRFLGAPLTANLDRTQSTLRSPPATADPGVVFAYSDLSDAIEEGFGAEIIEVSFKCAVRATHSQEAALDSSAQLPTILICSSDISHFRRLGSSKSLGGKDFKPRVIP